MRAFLLALLAVGSFGCHTLGVEPVEQTLTVRATESLEGARVVRVDVAAERDVEIVGGAGALAATLDVTAWVADASEVDLARDLQVDFRRRDDAIWIDPHYADHL